jgi:pimeloyl-ACP methyl ester carboxylesterase
MPYLDFQDSRLFYTLDGERGTPVILLTGFAVGGSVWEYQVPVLAQSHRVVCLDNRGGGLTEAPVCPWTIVDMARDVLALMDHLGFDRAHIVGCSMGGMVAQEVALLARHRVMTLSLIATHAGRLRDRRPRLETLRGFLRSNMGSRESRRKAVEGLLFPEDYLEHGPRDRIDHALERDFLTQPPLAARLAQLGAILRHDTSRRLHTLIGIPTLVMVAGSDRLLPPEGCEALAQLIPNATLVHIPEGGHGVIGQCSELVNNELLKHLTP